ncbi:hypothetical protein [Cerasicoccus arenae]|uniref:Uncharacterized protein n=1 Tax=Cerasicoccus arenae TaxID=424488 RepID=A0A8J3DER5_9BACT|nr:hypothetical protein [Cerasicoccus arenae]MBK1857698.1 hypothetical protein [Cerasicoccus arenae]GHB91304.1 hypothetical protein GCM10007047_02950 [Cerasicoccus arenae]
MKNLSELENYHTTECNLDEMREHFSSNSSSLPEHRRKEWAAFLSDLADGEVIWHFEADAEDWDRGLGAEGYIVVNATGQITRHLVTKIN